MATRIPTLGAGSKVRAKGPKTPKSDMRGSRALAQATSHLVKTATGTSLDLIEMREKSKANEYSSKKTLEYRQSMENWSRENKVVKESDPTGYAKSYQDEAERLKEQMVTEAPSGFAQDHFNSTIRNYHNSRILEADSWENTQRIKVKSALDDKESKEVGSSGNTKTAMSRYAMVRDNIQNSEGLEYGGETVKKKLAGLRFNYRKNYFTEMSDPSHPITKSASVADLTKYLDDMMDGKHPETSEVFDDISSKEKLSYKRSVLAAKKAAVSANQSAVFSEAKAALELAERGDVGFLAKSFDSVNSLPNSPKKSKMLSDIKIMGTVGSLIGGLENTDNQAISKMVRESGTIFSSGATAVEENSRDKAEMLFGMSASKMLKDRKNDPALSVIKSSPELINDPDKLLARQKELKIANPRVLTNDIASRMGVEFEESTFEGQSDMLDNVIRKYGKHASAVFNDIGDKTPGFEKSVVLAPYLDNKSSKEILLRNFKNAPTIRKEFADKHPGGESSVTSTVLDNIKDFTTVFEKSNNEFMATSIKDAVSLEAKRLMAFKGKSEDVAVEMATKSVLGDNFDFGNNHGGKTRYLIPKKIPSLDFEGNETFVSVDKGLVDTYVEGSLTRQVLEEELNITKANFLFPGSDEEFYEQAKESFFWANNKDQNGLKLYFTSRDGFVKPVKNSEAEPIVVPFDALKDHAVTEGTRLYNDLRGITRTDKEFLPGTKERRFIRSRED